MKYYFDKEIGEQLLKISSEIRQIYFTENGYTSPRPLGSVEGYIEDSKHAFINFIMLDDSVYCLDNLMYNIYDIEIYNTILTLVEELLQISIEEFTNNRFTYLTIDNVNDMLNDCNEQYTFYAPYIPLHRARQLLQ
jgi:hypothetical protein